MGSHCVTLDWKTTTMDPPAYDEKYQAPPPSYQPPPPSYQPPPPSMPVVTPVYRSLEFGPDPMTLVCPRCGEQVTTTIKTSASLIQHLGAFLCCIFGCWLGCCFLPYVLRGLHQTSHSQLSQL